MSLWDMLNFDARNILSALTFLGGTLGEYNFYIRVSVQREATLNNTIEGRASIVAAVQKVAEFAAMHGMEATQTVAKEAAETCLELLSPRLPMDVSRVSRISAAIEGALRVFIAEAQSRKFFAADAVSTGYYESADKLVGGEVVDRFPSIQFDIEEAGKCLTFGLWTASVMHLMRVHEVALQALASHLGVEAKENWNATLNGIEGALRLIRASKDGASAEQVAAEAGTHLRFIKNAYRNHVVHSQVSYDQKRARDMFEATRAFLEHLASALSEDGALPSAAI